MFRKIILGAVATVSCIAAQAAYACNFTYFECTPVTNTGAATYDVTTTCTMRIFHPTLDTACSALSAGLQYGLGRGVSLVATSANIANWAQVTYGPVLNDTPNRRAIITGTVPAGGVSTMVVALRARGACGTSTVVTANTSDTILRTEAVSRTFAFPACAPVAPTATATSTATATPTSGGGGSNTQCSDGIDNNANGLIDLADPGCNNSPSTPNENGAQTTSGVVVSLAGIYNNQDGTYTAYITYNNTTGAQVTLPAGVDSSTKNFFAPLPADRGQGSVFKVGLNTGAIRVTWNGTPIVYSVATAGAVPSILNLSASSTPVLQLVEPLGECLVTSSGASYTATMGYNNPNQIEISLPIGSRNFFTPGNQDRGQPTQFFKGLNKGAFVVEGTGLLEWKLPGKSAKVDSSTSSCGCPSTAGADIRSELNATALALNKLAQQSVSLLESLGTEAGDKSAADAEKRATSNLQVIQSLTVGIPNVIVSCPVTPPGCVRVDNQPTIDGIQEQYNLSVHIIKRATARANFLKLGKTVRNDPLVVKAKNLEKVGTAALKQYPRFSTSCGQ